MQYVNEEDAMRVADEKNTEYKYRTFKYAPSDKLSRFQRNIDKRKGNDNKTFKVVGVTRRVNLEWVSGKERIMGYSIEVMLLEVANEKNSIIETIDFFEYAYISQD